MKKIDLKNKITNYLNSLSDELRSKLEHRKNKPHTPKLNKLGKFALILFTVIYLLVGCLGGIKANALAADYVKIYSNDGSTLLFTSTNFYQQVDVMTVTSSGVTFPNESYTYSGDKEFLGLSSTVNSSEPVYPVGFNGAIGNFTFYIVEGENGNTSSAPSDLTGYTVTVPLGWSAVAGYGTFPITGTVDGQRFNQIAIGVNPYVGSVADFLAFTDADYGSLIQFDQSQNIVFTCTGGTDSASSSSSLIQWLVDNNATFVNNNAPEDPDPTTLTVPAGIYYLQNIYNDLRGTIDFDKPFTTATDDREFVSIEFAAYNQNNQYTQVFYYTNPVTDVGPSPSVPKPIYNGVNGFANISDCLIFLEEDTVIEYYDELWDDTFVAVNSDTKLINLYNGAFAIGDAEGFDRGYTVGDADGYQEGYDDGRAHGMEDGFMSNFFGGIVDALDALTLFGNISMLDIIEGILGLMLCLWILKLIAGG